MDKKRVNMEEYYNSLHRMPLSEFSKLLNRKTKCRVCLQDGDMPITSVRSPSDMREALNVFGNIEIVDDEKTCLCYICYKFLKSAILFRKVALRSNETLSQPSLKQSPDHLDDYDYLDNLDPFDDDKSKLLTLDNNAKEDYKFEQNKSKPKRSATNHLNDYDYLDTFDYDKSNLLSLDEYIGEEKYKVKEKKSKPKELPHKLDGYDYLDTFEDDKEKYAVKKKKSKRKKSPANDYNYLDTFDDKSNLLCSTKDAKEEYEVKKKEPRQKKFRKIPKVQCKICKKVLGKQYYYNIHLKLHNPNLPDEFVCDICGKSFKLKKVYLGHMERHETRYIYKCNLCPFAGRYKERLSMHMRVHTGELKYLCTQCPARYISRGRLNDHVRLKHTEPQFKCDSCEKAYHNSLTLQRHIEAAHLKIKKHQCDQCGQAFGYRHDMLKHQRIVHKRASLRPRFSKSAYKRISNKVECISDTPTA